MMFKKNFVSRKRIKALVYYHLITTFSNKSILIPFLLWPIIDLFILGFMAIYFSQLGNNATLITFILCALIFWNLTMKAQQELSAQFMKDITSRNLTNFLVCPIKKSELIISLIISNILKLILTFSVIFLAAYIFYALNIFQFNYWIILFVVNLLIFGWSLGIIAISFVLRFGYKVDFVIWTLAFLIQPISCVYYPRSILPKILFVTSLLNPISYTFEGIREFILNNKMPYDNLLISTILGIVFFSLSYIFFLIMFKLSKKSGSLTKF